MSQNVLRYYVHGDQVEGKPDEYYCASCDLFVDELHFRTHNDEPNVMNGLDKYNQSLKTWKVMKRKKAGYRRPNNPPNLFD
jgi:hypothetical protein